MRTLILAPGYLAASSGSKKNYNKKYFTSFNLVLFIAELFKTMIKTLNRLCNFHEVQILIFPLPYFENGLKLN